jgi:RNA polymerase sigma-70 factor (ECF subfamily)
MLGPLIRVGESPVSGRMSLEISTGAGAWQKGFRLPARLSAPPAARRKAIIGLMDARSGTSPEPNMSELLVKVGQTGDVELFELLFRHFAPRVKAYMAKTGSALAAEELMQETMVAVWNKAGLYDPSRGAASTWIFSIARNLRIDAYRREKHPEFDENDPAFQPAAEPAADRQLEGEQSAELVRAALEALPPDQAEVLRLAYYEDISQSEIATALALPLGTVKSRMRLAFSKLRAALGQTGDLS